MSLLSKIQGRKGEERAPVFSSAADIRLRYWTGLTERRARSHRAAWGVVVFVKAKTRTSDAFGAPEFEVTPHKQRRMIGAALG